MKKNRHIIILGVLFALLVFFEYTAPKPPDWTPTFKKGDKIPFGSYIMYDLLEDIFPQSNIDENDQSIYQFLNDKEHVNTSLIIITQDFNPEKVTLESILSFVESGNKAFVAATFYGAKFMDTLDFSSNFFIGDFIRRDSLPYNFKNKHLKNDSAYWVKSGWSNFYFDSVGNYTAKAIASIDEDKINYIRLKYGAGEFFIHNQPFAFTNYNLLIEDNAEYAFKSLSYLDNENIIWDENFKPGKVSTTPMRYILSQQSMKAAWYILLFLGLIFLFFSSKRKQRVIPVIRKPENSSLEFAKTLGNLYLSGKNHKDIALKKYHYWLNFLREKYYIHLESGEEPDIEKTAEKTGVNQELIKRIINANKLVKKSGAISSDMLLSFNRLIEKFHAFRK